MAQPLRACGLGGQGVDALGLNPVTVSANGPTRHQQGVAAGLDFVDRAVGRAGLDVAAGNQLHSARPRAAGARLQAGVVQVDEAGFGAQVDRAVARCHDVLAHRQVARGNVQVDAAIIRCSHQAIKPSRNSAETFSRINGRYAANDQVAIGRRGKLAQPDVAARLSRNSRDFFKFNALTVSTNVASSLKQHVVVSAVCQNFGVHPIQSRGGNVAAGDELDGSRARSNRGCLRDFWINDQVRACPSSV